MPDYPFLTDRKRLEQRAQTKVGVAETPNLPQRTGKKKRRWQLVLRRRRVWWEMRL